MFAVYLLVLVTTAQLLLCGHAAHVEWPNWQDGMLYSQDEDIRSERPPNSIQVQFEPYGTESYLERTEEMDPAMDMQFGEDNPDNGYSLATTEEETCIDVCKMTMSELLDKKKLCKYDGFDDCCQVYIRCTRVYGTCTACTSV